jgi:AraC family transcriptional regulator, regulatory protein of adaptative response / methylated-DNA-[protein]-cysteine methyltransferase
MVDHARIVLFCALLTCLNDSSGHAAGYRRGPLTYGSSRALYEKTRKGLGMTPAAYRHGGKGIHICYAVAQSALGGVLVARTGQGVCAVLLGEDDAVLIRELCQEFPAAVLRRGTSDNREAVQSCQDQDPLLSKLPVSLQGQVFLARIWNYLQ